MEILDYDYMGFSWKWNARNEFPQLKNLSVKNLLTLVRIPPSSHTHHLHNETLQSRPRHNHTPRDNSDTVTTQNETLQSRPRHSHTPRDNSALVKTQPLLA